jgi:carbonic anhydrase
MGLQPGEVFVHRNIANIIAPTDINSMAVIEYAVVHLKVKHIVLCGHTCCGGAAAALSDNRVGGVIDAWITPLKTIRKSHQAEIDALKDSGKQAVRLAELNVAMGVNTLMSNYVVEDAIKTRALQVHGAVYDVACGKIRDLGVGTDEGMSNTKILSGAAMKDPVTEPAVEEYEIVQGNHGMLQFSGEEAILAVV